jgi:hypothetical protein
MISNVFPTGRYVQVSGGTASTYINGYAGAQGIGNMRYNTSSQRMEVFDGSSWVMLNMGSASVGLSPEAESLLDWIKSKQRQEIELLELASTNQAVLIALENVKKAQEQLTITAHLAKEMHETTS